jgi:hypothetical protein
MTIAELRDLLGIASQLASLLLVPLVLVGWKVAKHVQRVEIFMKDAREDLKGLDTLTRVHDTSIAAITATLRAQEGG